MCFMEEVISDGRFFSVCCSSGMIERNGETMSGRGSKEGKSLESCISRETSIGFSEGESSRIKDSNKSLFWRG